MTGFRHHILRALAVALLPLLGACNNDSYKITGRAGECDGTAVLIWTDLQGSFGADTTSVKSGRFAFKGKIDDAYNGQIQLHPGEGRPVQSFLILEKGRISVTMYPDRLSGPQEGNSIPFCESNVCGTRNNDFLTALDKALHPEGKVLSAEETSEAMLDCIRLHKDCEYAAFLYGIYFAGKPLDEFTSEFESFPEYVQDCRLTAQIRRDIAFRTATAPGREAPDFTLKDMDGKDVTLSSFRGRYVVLDFWASWCVPCRRGVPAMIETYSKYSGKGLEIIAVSQDSDEQSWKKAVEEDRSEWIHLIDEPSDDNKGTRVGGLYGVRSIPAYFLIDTDGRFVGKFNHDELEAQLALLLQTP